MRFSERLLTPTTVTLASAGLGVGAAADTFTGGRLGLRGLAPQPFDAFNSGMSAAMGTVLAMRGLSSGEAKSRPQINESFKTVIDKQADLETRHMQAARMKKIWRGIGTGAIVMGSSYVVLGEIGSEVLHYIHDRNQADVPPEERKELTLGHLDPFDLIYGIGGAVAVTKLELRRKNRWLDGITSTIPEVKPTKPLAPTNRPAPPRNGKSSPKPKSGRPQQTNKRYTPPKNR